MGECRWLPRASTRRCCRRKPSLNTSPDRDGAVLLRPGGGGQLGPRLQPARASLLERLELLIEARVVVLGAGARSRGRRIRLGIGGGRTGRGGSGCGGARCGGTGCGGAG